MNLQNPENERRKKPAMNLTADQQKLATHLWAVTDFCLAHKGKAMPWANDRSLLFRYVADSFYYGKLNLAFRNDKIEAVVFAWADFKEHIEAKFAEDKPQFTWGKSHPGDALFIADTIGKHEAVARIYCNTIERFPNLMAVPFFTYRHGKLIEMNKARLEKFVRKAMR